MSTRPDPGDEPVRSGREFDERMFPPLVAPDSKSQADEDPDHLGARAALQVLERLRAGAGAGVKKKSNKVTH